MGTRIGKLPRSATELEQDGRPGFIGLGLVLAAVYALGFWLFVPPMAGRELLLLPVLVLVGFSGFHAFYVVRAARRERSCARGSMCAPGQEGLPVVDEKP
jgi:hypothetical protein